MVPNFDVLGKICLLTAYTFVQVCCLTFDHIAILYAHTYVGLCDSVAPDRPGLRANTKETTCLSTK